MKKVLLFVITGFTMVITSHAQISGGLKTGFNLATFGGEAKDAKLKPGFNIGVYMNIGLNKKLSFQPELQFNTVGVKTQERGDRLLGSGYSFQSTTKLSYINIPLSLQYSFGSFTIHAGPQLGFLMSAKSNFPSSYIVDGFIITTSGEKDVKKYLNGVDMALNFGAGYSFGKLGVNARYSLGILNIAAGEKDGDSKITNNVIQVGVMYKWIGN